MYVNKHARFDHLPHVLPVIKHNDFCLWSIVRIDVINIFDCSLIHIVIVVIPLLFIGRLRLILILFLYCLEAELG